MVYNVAANGKKKSNPPKFLWQSSNSKGLLFFVRSPSPGSPLLFFFITMLTIKVFLNKLIVFVVFMYIRLN